MSIGWKYAVICKILCDLTLENDIIAIEGKMGGKNRMNILINTALLNNRAAALRTAGETFVRQELNSIDTTSTLSAITNSVTAHNETNQIHVAVGEYLTQSADLIVDIGRSFFEIDQEAANTMQAER